MLFLSMDTRPERRPEPDDFLTTAPAARVIGRSEGFVRKAADDGRLPSVRTSTGQRLFLRRDILNFRDE
jgi:excisionase family DNA binding protein